MERQTTRNGGRITQPPPGVGKKSRMTAATNGKLGKTKLARAAAEPHSRMLLAAMAAALAAGGEEGPLHSAGMLLVRDVPWPVADLRVDWSDGDPIADLHRVWTIYKPQLEDYVNRALNPTAAPSFGVPGDR